MENRGYETDVKLSLQGRRIILGNTYKLRNFRYAR